MFNGIVRMISLSISQVDKRPGIINPPTTIYHATPILKSFFIIGWNVSLKMGRDFKILIDNCSTAFLSVSF